MRGFLCLAFTILLVLGMFWASPYRAMNQAEAVETVGCERADIFNAVTMSGKTESASETKVYAPSAAWVEKLYVSQGTEVKKGEALALLQVTEDPEKLRQATREAGEKMLESLLQDAQDGSLEEDSQALLSRAAGAGMEESPEPAQEEYILYAPCGGTVMDVFFSEGETVSPLLPCFTLADLSQMVVKAQVGEENLPQIQPGMFAEMTLTAFPDTRLTGKVQSVAPYAKAASLLDQSGGVSTDVIFSISNDVADVKPGYTVSVKVRTESREDTLLLPYPCVAQDEQNREYVMVVQEGRARKMLVETGLEVGEQVEITAGLTGEERVIRAPGSLKTGQAVAEEEEAYELG